MVEITHPDSRVTRLRVGHRLDVETAEHFRERFDRQLAAGNRIIIVFEAGSFVDAAGLWTLLGLIDRARQELGSEAVALVSRSRSVDQLIRMTRLDRYAPVFETWTDAAGWLEDRSR